jgi:hypothetical protein
VTGVTRRALLGGAAGVTGFAAMPMAFANPRPDLHIFDSRLDPAPRLARAMHDIANEDATHWRVSRGLAVKPGVRVTGVTRWSDWVILRSLFNERGLRTRSLSMTGSIATWEMG